jgi:hypothetical protein
MTGHDRLLNELVNMCHRLAESERRNVESMHHIDNLTDTLARRDARIESLERQLWDLAVRP